MQKENHAAHGHYVFLIMDLASRKGCPFLEKYVFYYINYKRYTSCFTLSVFDFEEDSLRK